MNFDIGEVIEEAVKLLDIENDEIDNFVDQMTTILDGQSLKTCITALSLALAEILIIGAPNKHLASKGANLSTILVSIILSRAASENDPDDGEVHTLQ